jgi:hypothetical protein
MIVQATFIFTALPRRASRYQQRSCRAFPVRFFGEATKRRPTEGSVALCTFSEGEGDRRRDVSIFKTSQSHNAEISRTVDDAPPSVGEAVYHRDKLNSPMWDMPGLCSH